MFLTYIIFLPSKEFCNIPCKGFIDFSLLFFCFEFHWFLILNVFFPSFCCFGFDSLSCFLSLKLGSLIWDPSPYKHFNVVNCLVNMLQLHATHFDISSLIFFQFKMFSTQELFWSVSLMRLFTSSSIPFWSGNILRTVSLDYILLSLVFLFLFLN